MENEVKTVNIPIEEYFELRKKAEISLFLTGKISEYESIFRDIDRRLNELEFKLRGK